MTRPEWEPLTTAEEVVEALSDGREVQEFFNDEYEWMTIYARSLGLIKHMQSGGAEYRARIEGGAE